MQNRMTFEFLILAAIFGLGIPVFVLLGASDGERLASLAYPNKDVRAVAVEDYQAMVKGSPAAVVEGKDLFQQNCTACHGPEADGKGAAAISLTPSPRNFLDPKAVWTRGRQPLDIYRTLSEGSPGTAMAGFSQSLSVKDRWALVHYLGTLSGVAGQFQPVDDAVAGAWKPEGGR
jgi:mono/diheme cytochrome c family protein